MTEKNEPNTHTSKCILYVLGEGGGYEIYQDDKGFFFRGNFFLNESDTYRRHKTAEEAITIIINDLPCLYPMIVDESIKDFIVEQFKLNDRLPEMWRWDNSVSVYWQLFLGRKFDSIDKIIEDLIYFDDTVEEGNMRTPNILPLPDLVPYWDKFVELSHRFRAYSRTGVYSHYRDILPFMGIDHHDGIMDKVVQRMTWEQSYDGYGPKFIKEPLSIPSYIKNRYLLLEKKELYKSNLGEGLYNQTYYTYTDQCPINNHWTTYRLVINYEKYKNYFNNGKYYYLLIRYELKERIDLKGRIERPSDHMDEIQGEVLKVIPTNKYKQFNGRMAEMFYEVKNKSDFDPNLDYASEIMDNLSKRYFHFKFLLKNKISYDIALDACSLRNPTVFEFAKYLYEKYGEVRQE